LGFWDDATLNPKGDSFLNGSELVVKASEESGKSLSGIVLEECRR